MYLKVLFRDRKENLFNETEAIVFIDRLKEVCLSINPAETSHLHNANFHTFFSFVIKLSKWRSKVSVSLPLCYTKDEVLVFMFMHTVI